MKVGWKKFRITAVLSSILLLSLLPVFTACSKNNSGNTAESSNPPSQSQSATPVSSPSASPSSSPSASPATKDPVTLTVLTWFVGPNQALFDKFHEMYPWITIKANTSINGGVIKNVIAGDQADLLFLDNGLSEWMSGDLLEELTPYVAKDQRIQNAKKVDGFLEAFQTGGKQWTIPFSDIPMWIIVNKDMLKKYGMTMPGNDWTYDDLLAMAKKATNPAANDWGMIGMGDEFTQILSLANGSSDNYRYFNKDMTASVANTPQVLQDLKWSQDLTNKWHVQPSSAEAKKLGFTGDAGAEFAKGNFLFMLGADWHLEGLQKSNVQWDVLPMPKGKVRQATVHQAGPIAIPKSSKHKEEAFLYISFLFDIEAQKIMIANGDNAFVKDPVLEQYYNEVPVWKGRNAAGVQMGEDMMVFSRDPAIANLGDYVNKVEGPIAKTVSEGGSFDKILPAVEAYNTKAAETRKALGW